MRRSSNSQRAARCGPQRLDHDLVIAARQALQGSLGLCSAVAGERGADGHGRPGGESGSGNRQSWQLFLDQARKEARPNRQCSVVEIVMRVVDRIAAYGTGNANIDKGTRCYEADEGRLNLPSLSFVLDEW
jgi:hypothetical protein